MQTKEYTPLQFEREFRSESQCINYIFKNKYPEGFYCQKCGCNEYYLINHRGGSWQCKNCNYQESAKKGTLFEKSHLPLSKWFRAIFELTVTKCGISATELSFRLGISYQTAWTMLHKIRAAMGLRDEKYSLSGVMELDGAHFGHRTTGTETKVYIAVEERTNKKGKVCAGFAKAHVTESLNKKEISDFSSQNIKEDSIIKTDKGKDIPGLKDDDSITIIAKKMSNDPQKLDDHLPWVHKLISNIKIYILGTYHGVSMKYLQLYLDEYLYRFNRRFWPKQLYVRLVNACIDIAPAVQLT